MSIVRVPSARHPASRSRLRPLVAALALAGLAAPFAAATAQTTHIVTTCDDPPGLPVCDGDNGTLRQALFCAADGDRVDLTQLQCSKITLAAPLIVGTIGVAIDGPGRNLLTIDAGDAFRAIVHNGRPGDAQVPGDTLTVDHVTIANGRYENPYSYGGGGGCIFSSGNVFLFDAEVSSCYTVAVSTIATGGGIYAKGDATLAYSTVTGSTAVGFLDKKYAVARGGGVYANSVTLYKSTVSGNLATASNSPSDGGGVYATHFVGKYSTVSGNQATRGGGVTASGSFLLANGTISGNRADYLGAASTSTAAPVGIYNSTIAFNTANAATSVGGIGTSNMRLESSIVANNTAAGAPADIAAAGAITGANNLVIASNAAVPPDTIVADPGLEPLRFNGGFAWTHALAPNSPAIDGGNNVYGSDIDERAYDRVDGAAPDIGAFESDVIFAGNFDDVE